MKPRCNIIFFVGFLLCLWLPLAVQMADIHPPASLHMPSGKASWPVYSGASTDIDAYKLALQHYYDTNFGLRDWLASIDTAIRIYWLDSHHPSLILPKEPPPLCDYSGFYKDDFAQEALQFAKNQARLGKQHIKYVVMIVPTKNEIMQSLKCGNAFVRNNYSDALHHQVPDLWIVDLFNAMRLSQAQHHSFYITDIHWNNTGAFAAYQTLIHALSQKLTIPDASNASDFLLEERTFSAPPTLENITQKLPFTETDTFYVLKPSKRAQRIDINKNLVLPMWHYNTADEIYMQDNSALPHAVIFQSSMFEPLKPWVAEHFGRTYYHWANTIDWDIIAQEKPDIVIQQILR